MEIDKDDNHHPPEPSRARRNVAFSGRASIMDIEMGELGSSTDRVEEMSAFTHHESDFEMTDELGTLGLIEEEEQWHGASLGKDSLVQESTKSSGL